jgi:citrate lyase subunit beta/citryl-CoA lyase
VQTYRSLLFVPAHKEDWVDKAVASGTDAVILDLEDAVPEADKTSARTTVAASIDRLSVTSEVGVIVRVNPLDSPHFGADLEAVVRPGLVAVLVPKIFSVEDVVAYDALIRHFEISAGVAVGSVGIIPSFETAQALTNAETIALGPRVVTLMAAAAKDADISRSIGFRWTRQGLETLHIRSRVVLAARAAGLSNVILGLWQDLHDLGGLREFAESNRDLGFTGQVLIHPSHVSIINETYGHSEAELSRLRELIEAYETGAQQGHGAVMFDGEHIDWAHAEHARAVLRTTGRALA